jgi:hypothetical protein
MKILLNAASFAIIVALLIFSCKKKADPAPEEEQTTTSSTTGSSTTSGSTTGSSTTGSTSTSGTTGGTSSTTGNTTGSTTGNNSADVDKFLGTKDVEEYCTAQTDYLCGITRENSTSSKIFFSNFWDIKNYFGITQKVYGIVSGNTIDIPNQSVSGGGYTITFKGTGTYMSASLTNINYTAKVQNGNNFTCSAKYKN